MLRAIAATLVLTGLVLLGLRDRDGRLLESHLAGQALGYELRVEVTLVRPSRVRRFVADSAFARCAPPDSVATPVARGRP